LRFRVDVFERCPDIRLEEAINNGCSISIALCTHGVLALKALGAGNAVLHDAIPMHGRIYHTTDGKQHVQPYGQGRIVYSLSRPALNQRLMTLAESTGAVRFHFQHTCTDYRIDSN
jgi:kynurenine 3-monooxygenase